MTKRAYHPEIQFNLFDLPEGPRFVVHAHKTRYGVHHDFRFEVGKVLLDFCLPHGFSVNPSHVRRALEQPVHDRKCLTMPEWCAPAENGDKEVMMRWDEGTMIIHGDPEETQVMRLERGLCEGSLRIELTGVKLNGVWTLTRDHRVWKVQKEKDKHASKRNILRENWSVLTQRTFPLVAAEMGVHDGVKFTPMQAA